MSLQLPPAQQVRAVVVGLEHYSGLGHSFAAPGAVTGALDFARWLVHGRGVAASSLSLWLRPLAAGTAQSRALGAGLDPATVREFSWAAFFEAMAQPQGAFKDGRFLMVYFCGHGVVHGTRAQQYLVLPEATERQFQCLDTQNWRELFKGSGWERYGHQLWVVDACRNQWGEAMRVLPMPWNLGLPSAVRQCVLMSCLTGESSAIDSALGPRFTRELLASLSQAPAGEWPDFEHALREAAAALHADPALAQSATLIAGDDWQGLPLLGRGLEGRRLIDVLGDIDWSYERFKPYLLRALPAQTLVQMPADLQAGIELLQGLLPLAGVPPVLDFAERVARASGLDALRDWVDLRLSKHQRAELASRLSKSGYRARLRLWYRDEAEPPSIEAELDIIDAGAGAPPWQRAAAKPTAPGTVCGTVGQWVQAAYNHLGRQDGELVVELYLPRGLLAADAYDTARVPLDGGDEMQLGHELPTLLRCTDRYKSHAKLGRLRRHGPSILARLGADASQGLRWALPQDTADGLHQAFVAPASACVWLGFEAQGAGGHQPLAHALEVGLPAVLWLRAQAQAAAWAAAQPSLQTLLNSPLAELPARLAVWRDAQVDAAARNVAVLLDDPAQLPALLNQWLQPGG